MKDAKRTLIITKGNRPVYDTMAKVFLPHEDRLRLFVHGPSESGKTAFARGFCEKRKPLSSRTALLIHPSLLTLMLTTLLEQSQGALGNMAESDVLIIDSLDDAFLKENQGVGPEAVSRLVAARNRTKHDTVVFARKPIECYGEVFGQAFKGFEQIEMKPLDYEGRIEFFRLIQEEESKNSECARVFSEDALAFFASSFADDLSYGRHGAIATLRSEAFPEQAVITEAMIRSANV